MLDDVGDIGELAVDPGFLERPVEQLSGGPDERPAGEVLLVAGLLADEHQPGLWPSFAEDGLRARLPEVTAFAPLGGVANLLERLVLGGEKLVGHEWYVPSRRYHATSPGAVAEWLGRGLQSLAHRFDSGPRLFL